MWIINQIHYIIICEALCTWTLNVFVNMKINCNINSLGKGQVLPMMITILVKGKGATEWMRKSTSHLQMT